MECSKNIVKYLICFIFCGLTACSEGGSSGVTPGGSNHSAEKPTADQYAKGAINGRAWKFVRGRATPFRRNNKRYLELRLWNQEFANPCNELQGSIFQMRIYVSYSEGSWKVDPLDPFTLIPTIIFADYTSGLHSRSNLIADRGSITVSILNPDSVSGVLEGSFSNAKDIGLTQVAGAFDVPICEP